ncbi:MAG TPA: hypothetical protein VHS31_10260 [Tepidisphaeraceae bacterium]|jgi:hypothetical protein|nr:hypothetical protein [Tepidisphaeraceae bacterium]
MSVKGANILFVLAGLCLFAGCAAPNSKPAGTAQPNKLTVDDLDQITYVYADRYMTLISSACDEIVRDNPSAQQRLTAMQVKRINCSSIYDIATSPDAFSRLLDMTLVVTLQAQVWIDDGRANQLFGNRAHPLELALRQARRDIWKISSQALTPDQMEGFDRLILRWRRDNPDVEFVSYVRFNDVATGRARAVAAAIRHGEGLLAPIDEAKESVDQVRALSERMFYFAKRMPFLLDWQGQEFVEQILQKPEVHTLVQRIDQLPNDITAQREALFKDLDQHQPMLTDLIEHSRGAVNDINATVKSTDETLQHMKETSDSLRQTLQQWDLMRTKYTSEPPSTEPSRPFDITEYDRTAQSLDRTAKSLNELLKSSDALMGSAQLTERVNQVDSLAQARIQQAISESKGMVGFTFTQMVFLCAIFFGFLTVYSVLSGWIRRRFAGKREARA